MVTVYNLALLSGLFQALGYLVYIRKSLRHEVEPNPTTWFMFAYGTAMLAVLEWDRNADFTLLILPITCALLSLRVAAICWSQGRLKWPDSWLERFAFLMDLSLTVAYISMWLTSRYGAITSADRNLLVLVFLVLTNASTIVSFIPILGGTWDNPRKEHPLPWSIWCFAYCTLGYVTYLEHGVWSEFMIYPVSNALLHGLMGVFALRRYGTAAPRRP